MYQLQRIGQRGIVVTYDELVGTEYDTDTNIYLIDTEKTLFICDTYLGPEVLAPILREVNPDGEKRMVVVNSHYHWDHIWGNCYFSQGELIVAHPLCRERIAEDGAQELAKLAEFQMGEVEIVLPNLTFEDELVFEEEGVVIFYSPGHSEDSISVYDRVDQILFAGDNVELPIPSYMESRDLEAYRLTLARYLELEWKQVVPGHRQVLNRADLEQNLRYLEDLLAGGVGKYGEGEFAQNHRSNQTVYREDL